MGSGLVASLMLGGIGQWRFLQSREATSFQVRARHAGTWARQHLAANDLIGMTDCGTFGYSRGDHVVNLDGVVNTLAYQRALRDSGLAEYLSAERVRYVAFHAVPDDSVARRDGRFRYAVASHLYGTRRGSLDLTRTQEVYRSAPYDEGNGVREAFVIWRLGAAEGIHER